MKSAGHWLFVLLIAVSAPSCNSKDNDKPPVTIADDPTTFVATPATTAKINLTWVDASDNEFEFRIQRADAAGGPFVQIGSAPMNSTSYSDFGLQANKPYFYRIVAWNSAGDSGFAAANATTNPLTWGSVTMVGGPPVGRGEHSAIYDSFGRRMLVFGGIDDSLNVLSQLWSLNLNLDPIPASPWSAPATTGAAPMKFGHSAIYDTANHRMIVFGGFDENLSLTNTVHLLNLTTLTWSQATPTGTPPPARAYQTAIYDSGGQRMIVHGGNDGAAELADTYFLSLPPSPPYAWTAPPVGTPMIGRSRHSSTYDPFNTRMIIFAGVDQDGAMDGSLLNNETWSLTPALPSWNQLFFSGTPTFRMGHSGVYDAANRRMVIFAGTTSTVPVMVANDLWAMRLDVTPSWSILTAGGGPPTARTGHTAVYDSVHNRMIIYGGFDDVSNSFNTAWVIKL